MLMSSELWLTQLQQNGYRLTGARRAVVETVQKSTRAVTPLQVYDMARKKYRALGLVTVYRTLEKLEELHIIQRVHQPLGCQAFITASSDMNIYCYAIIAARQTYLRAMISMA